jgi:hypothetical protein
MDDHPVVMADMQLIDFGSLREWPSHFPAGCPPNDAADLDGVVYMLVATNPSTADDFKCARDRGTFRNKPECLRASLSCALDADHLNEVREASPRLANHITACAALNADHGKIKQTGKPGHYSMWLRERHLSIGHELFKVLS